MNSLLFRNGKRATKFLRLLKNNPKIFRRSTSQIEWSSPHWKNVYNFCEIRQFCSNFQKLRPDNISEAQYDQIVDETLDSLCEYFETLGDRLIEQVGKEFDVCYSQGVLTVKLGAENVGKIYVINKQTPNKQIWLSSPYSGPKRYDLVEKRWIYLHDGVCLHDLLTDELKRALKNDKINFSKCTYGASETKK